MVFIKLTAFAYTHSTLVFVFKQRLRNQIRFHSNSESFTRETWPTGQLYQVYFFLLLFAGRTMSTMTAEPVIEADTDTFNNYFTFYILVQ